MTFDGITTRSVIEELQRSIVGGVVKKVNQIGEKQITFQIYGNGANWQLFLSADAQSARFHLSEQKYENPQTPPNFCMLLRKHLTSARLERIEQKGLDRTVSFVFSARNELGDPVERTLVAEIMGKYSNLILLNERNHVLDAIQRVSRDMSRVRQIYPGIAYNAIPSGKRDITKQPLATREELETLPGNGALFRLFYQNFTGFSPLIGQEICFRAALDSDRTLDSLTETERETLWQAFDSVQQAIRKNDFSPALYHGRRDEFYSLSLQHLGAPIRTFDSISAAIDAYSLIDRRTDRIGQRRQTLLNTTQAVLDKKLKKQADRRADYQKTEDAERFREEGDLLATSVHLLTRGQHTVEVEDFICGGKRTITLDPKKNAWENVQAKYKKHSKLKRSRQILEKYLPVLEEEIRYLGQVLDSIRRADQEDVLEEIREELQAQKLLPRKRKKKKKAKMPAPSTPLVFTSPSGLRVLVGRNNRQNDRLTLRVADKDDFFLHAKDIPGAHVILRTEHKSPTEADILFAAQLAAAYSAAGEESFVAVDCTEKKNVYKAKGAKPGMVYYNDYRTLRVQPSRAEDKRMKE
uniref:Rqc2 family fibronectin-binding protein n=1 Tax=Ndongobacter massiliensis TaxID=1871025 RepID=UPI0009306EE7|nr:NFACT RNA binding domain-containing protein [Ndongobacter massiliensis]